MTHAALKSSLSSLLVALVLAPSAAAAPQGAPGPAPGLRMYGPHGTTDTFLVDTNGTVVHTWPGGYTPGNGMYLLPDGSLIRAGKVTGIPIGGSGGAVQRIAFDGTVLWDYQIASATQWSHHDIAPLPNGNILFIVWDRMTAADAIAAGRDPALITGTDWLPDSILEVQPTGPTTGDVVWEWHFMDHVIQDFDPSKANYGVVANHPELLDINYPPSVTSNGDWNHANSVAYDPVRDLIVLNCPFQNEFYFIDHSTTTAEAAGHSGGTYGKGGDFVYRWGNPQAYRAGTMYDQTLYFPHGTYIIPEGLPGAGNVVGFNNRAGTPVSLNYSAVYELQLPPTFNLAAGAAYGPTGFLWEYTATPPTSFYSSGLSNVEKLPNGNMLICSGRQGWIFEVNQSKQKVWEYFNTQPTPSSLVFQVSYYERYLWADRESVSAAAGDTVQFDLVAGSPHAGRLYILLGSATGTSPGFVSGGFTLPLNVDAYTHLTIAAAGGPTFPNFFGTLDPLGRATASLVLPPVPGLAGLQLHHAFAVVGPTSTVALTSNAVPLQLQQ